MARTRKTAVSAVPDSSSAIGEFVNEMKNMTPKEMVEITEEGEALISGKEELLATVKDATEVETTDKVPSYRDDAVDILQDTRETKSHEDTLQTEELLVEELITPTNAKEGIAPAMKKKRRTYREVFGSDGFGVLNEW